MQDPDAPAVEMVNPEGPASVLLLCDHASPRIPGRLGDLGLRDELRHDHIGWDPGVARVARRMAALLDAPLVLSGYSRLVIDCNRPPGVPSSIPRQSGGVDIPGNAAVDAAEAAARAEALFWPYHRAIAALLDERVPAGRTRALLSLHSFTPTLLGQARPWHVGVMYGRDRRLAELLLPVLRRDAALCVGDNQPYQVSPETDYSIPVHGEARGLPCVLIELRNDGLRHEEGTAAWAARLAAAYREVEPGLP